MTESACPLETILSEVLANMAFMFGEPVAGEALPEPDWFECSIGYHGPQLGRLTLRCPQAFAVLLAANLLGLDPASPDLAGQIEDTVKELLNVICGQTVTALYGRVSAFDLEIPCMQRLAAPPPSLARSPDAVELCVEGHLVQLSHSRVSDADDAASSIPSNESCPG